MIAVLVSSFLLAYALPTPVVEASPVLSSTDLLHSTVQEWSSEDIKFLRHLLPLEERQGLMSIDEEIPSRYKDMIFDRHGSTSAPFERPIPIMDTSSTITTPPTFFDIDITSSRRISLDPIARASKTQDGGNLKPPSSRNVASSSARRISLDNTEPDKIISASNPAIKPTPIARASKTLKMLKKKDVGNLKKSSSPHVASLGDKGKVGDGKERVIHDRTYAKLGTTVFDVWRDWNLFMKDTYNPNTIGQLTPKRANSMRIIADELKSRMDNANRTIKEALNDLEGARLKMVKRGGSGGTIASLVAAIRLKNGKKIDLRLKKYLPLEYEIKNEVEVINLEFSPAI
jgi:hypothetical protein